jgi:hypothetical protein
LWRWDRPALVAIEAPAKRRPHPEWQSQP